MCMSTLAGKLNACICIFSHLNDTCRAMTRVEQNDQYTKRVVPWCTYYFHNSINFHVLKHSIEENAMKIISFAHQLNSK